MRIIGINLINTTFKQQSFRNYVQIPILKDTFELQNNSSISFGRKKTKEKQDKNQLYKQLRKAGCGEKDTNSILYNEKKYKHLLKLMSEKGTFERELTPKEMVAIVSNEFNEEQTQRFINLTTKKISKSPLAQKEAVAVIKNNVEDKNIQRFIELRAKDENGNSLLSRPLTNSEACLVCNNDLDNEQAQTYITLSTTDFYYDRLAFVKDKEKVKRFIELTSKNQNGEPPLSRELTIEEAVKIVGNNFDNEQAQRVINLVDNPDEKYSRTLDFKEAEIIIKAGLDGFQVQKFIDLKDDIYQRDGEKSYRRSLNDKNIAKVIKENFDIQKIDILYELANNFYEDNAMEMVTNKNKYERILSLTQKDTPLPKILTISEAGFVVRNNLNNIQAANYKRLIDNQIRSYDALNFVKDEKKLKRFLELTNPEIKEISRPLNEEESILAIDSNYDYRKIQELINLKDNNPELTFEYISTLIKFIDYKDKKTTQELTQKEKREFLKLLVKNNASLFNKDISSDIYPLVPKNQEVYCKLLPILTAAIGINTNPISEEEKKDFEQGINNLIKSIQNQSDRKATEESLEKIYIGIPELKKIDLEKHILKILEKVVQNPKFDLLNETDKKILTIATLLHKISDNPEESAFDAFYIMQRFNFSEDEQLKIYELIKTSDWLEKLNATDKENSQIIAQDIAFETRHSNTFELSKILCEANLSDKKFSTKQMEEQSERIDFYLNKLQENQIFLPQTKIPNASEMKNCKIMNANGITNTVLYINQIDNDLSKYGFEAGTTVENWQGLVHGLDSEQQLQTFTTFSLIDSEALLSSSYMNPREYKVFRKQGIILDVNPNDIHAGYHKDFGSGFKKDIEELKRLYLFGKRKNASTYERDRYQYRTYIPNLIKKSLDISNKEYVEIIKKLEGCRSITDIEKSNKKFADVMLEIFKTIHFGERKYNRQYNEILISRPKIQGVFSYGQSYENIPIFLRKYAQDNDLPIIMFGNYQ